VTHVPEVLRRFQRSGFSLNPDKIVFGASELKYPGHLISAMGVKILFERVIAIQDYPCPVNLRSLGRMIGRLVSMPHSSPLMVVTLLRYMS